MDKIDYQSIVDRLADFIELRFGVYLDTIMGFQYILEKFKVSQQQTVRLTKLTVEKIDKIHLIRGNGPPSSDLEVCKKREIHRMTQAAFKKNNSPGGVNYDFAIENCLSDIYNYWKIILKKLVLANTKDEDAFPVMAYIRKLRNRTQHDPYGERIVTEKDAIEIEKAITDYQFPTFKVGQHIHLSKEDVEALVFETRSQFSVYLIPYINNL